MLRAALSDRRELEFAPLHQMPARQSHCTRDLRSGKRSGVLFLRRASRPIQVFLSVECRVVAIGGSWIRQFTVLAAKVTARSVIGTVTA
jgi:hypothetical protein